MLNETNEILDHMLTCQKCRLRPMTSALFCCICGHGRGKLGDTMYLLICPEVETGFALCQSCLDEWRDSVQIRRFNKVMQDFKERISHVLRTE